MANLQGMKDTGLWNYFCVRAKSSKNIQDKNLKMYLYHTYISIPVVRRFKVHKI